MEVNSRKLIRNFVIEVVVYGVLVVAYFLLVLQSLGEWLTYLYENNLGVYAVVALILIVVQGVLFEKVTTFLVERLGLERLE
ncbi:MAG TPA: hypothetical protein VLE70_11215 [Anaerolineae bacterium]|jgi:hypothetical protein|nr:hypothetical protein [Anaerolineae bacterium]